MNKKPHLSYEAYRKDIDGDIEELEKELKRCHKCVKYETQRTLNKLKRERDDFDSMIEKELQFWLTDQIIAMWYVPARKKRRATIPGYYRGKSDKGTPESLNTEWVNQNISPEMRNFLQSNARRRYELPPGDVRNSGIKDISKLKVPNAPKCVYQQNDRCTCVFSGFASCLHHIGHEKMAARIQAVAAKQSLKVNNLERLRVAVEASIGKACCVRKYKKGKLDLLDSQQQYENDGKAHPTIVVLQGHDGGTEHAVIVYGSSWLFDSNVEVALPLTRDVLNWCVQGKYVCVHTAVRFFLPKPKQERKRPKQVLC